MYANFIELPMYVLEAIAKNDLDTIDKYFYSLEMQEEEYYFENEELDD